uniref:Uncharacterized protein n=1 Tax=Oryzias latipes TaxID=8090 RepID=A0A3B3IE88_ORYLA
MTKTACLFFIVSLLTGGFAEMNVSRVILACSLLTGASWGSKTGQPPKTSCRPGFSQNFYTVIVSGDVLHGQSILKGEPAAACLALLSDVFFLSLLCSDLSPSLLSVWRETYNMVLPLPLNLICKRQSA